LIGQGRDAHRPARRRTACLAPDVNRYTIAVGSPVSLLDETAWNVLNGEQRETFERLFLIVCHQRLPGIA
jgi:hypothetical protein